MPQRIQRKRERGWRMPEGAVYVGRPSRWGNPFVVGETYLFGNAQKLGPGPLVDWPMPTWREPGDYDHGIRVERCPDAATAVKWYRAYASQPSFARYFPPIRGKDLADWCPLDQPCHADVLLELANR